MVEDEALLRMVAVDIFEDAGFRVIVAETADEGALMLVNGEAIDGLFTDIEMPGAMNGLDLARIASHLQPAAAILIVSGRIVPSPGDLPPRTQFLGKPYDANAVPRIMAHLMPGFETR